VNAVRKQKWSAIRIFGIGALALAMCTAAVPKPAAEQSTLSTSAQPGDPDAPQNYVEYGGG
jgi:hypothetical protein